MGRRQAECLSRERDFQIGELFFSTTDKRGVIRSGNEVFTRVSGYEEDETLGRAHSIVRHPHMPAAVFSLFWSTIQSGDSIAAYVKNRAKEGEYYWVMAMATPTQDGYLSVRLKPSSELFQVIQQVYQQVLAEEHAAEDRGKTKDEVVKIGLAALNQRLHDLGFESYTRFMQHALTLEMTSRHRALHANSGADDSACVSQPRWNKNFSVDSIAAMTSVNADCDTQLDTMLGQIERLKLANEKLIDAGRAIQNRSESIATIAINAKVFANTPVLAAISGLLSAAENDNSAAIKQLHQTVEQLMQNLDKLSFEVCVAALQGEISTHYLRELQIGLGAEDSIDQLKVLMKASDRAIDSMCGQLEVGSGWFQQLESVTNKLQRNAKSLRFIRTAGVTESSNLSRDHAFAALFDQIKAHIEQVMDLCSVLRGEVLDCKRVIQSLLLTKSRLEVLMVNRRQASQQVFQPVTARQGVATV